MGLAWYVARTKPLAEYVSRDRLRSAGFEVFMPCVRSRRPRPGRRDEPLFPGYLFIQCDLATTSRAMLRRLPQPVSLVGFGGVTPPLPDTVVGQLLDRVSALDGGGGLWTQFQVGDRVMVSSGSLEGLAQVDCDTNSPRQRVRVLMEFMGQLVRAEVPWWEVRPTTEHDPFAAMQDLRRRRTRGRGRWIRGSGPRAAATHELAAAQDNGRPSS